MDKKELVCLTNKVYKQTLLFPKKEPLRIRIRETADEILEKKIKGQDVGKELELMDAYLEIVKWQNWVSYFDIIRIKDEYQKVKELEWEPEALAAERTIKKEEAIQTEIPDPEIDERKKKIIKILKEKESAQVGDIIKILPNVSKRTLRRDFDLLIRKGVVQRIGESNNTFYKLN